MSSIADIQRCRNTWSSHSSQICSAEPRSVVLDSCAMSDAADFEFFSKKKERTLKKKKKKYV